eukprot:TRINITY_DN791_c0_g1_i1.p1 TRINITY_DN791_c0_g1~~TRINITY_DN791_c0_g1_i1.p1  ORF type:complete len:310 (+),score=45.44 TRINITY_DN791_c0_g1_i1:51-932(+)
MKSLSAAALLLCCAAVSAHLCMNYPPQRGGVPLAALSAPGLGLCAMTQAPCGSVSGDPTASFSPDEYVRVQLILNQQHLSATPGNFTMTYCGDSDCTLGTNYLPLEGGTLADSASLTSPTTIDLTIRIPSSLSGNIVVRATYYTDGADPAAPVYYVCSDVRIDLEEASGGGGLDKLAMLGYSGTTILISIIVLIILVAAIIVGVVFGVKKWRQRRDSQPRSPEFRNPAYQEETPSTYNNNGTFRNNGNGYNDPGVGGRGGTVPMMNMRDIQRNLMSTAPDYSTPRTYGHQRAY